LTSRFKYVGHANDGFFRIDNAEINDGVDFYRHVIAGDNVLRRNVQDDNAEIHFRHYLQAGDQDDQPGALHNLEAAEEEYDATFILFENLDRVIQNDNE
jgi:hypothetical protein